MTLIKCSIEGCKTSFYTSESVSSSVKYVCKNHPVEERESVGFQEGQVQEREVPKFQESQFDPSLNKKSWLPEFLGTGFHIVTPVEHNFTIPEWVMDDGEVQRILLRSFPNLNTNPLQRQRASRWNRIIYLHYRLRYTYAQIAEEMELTEAQVRRLIHSISRASAGLRANGTGAISGKKGRPRKSSATI